MKLFRYSPKQAAFTIVELLIVIVVIGILAAITIVAYNGIQQRANNTKTQQAMASWVKGLDIYRGDKGQWPSGFACLGEGYLYGPNGTDTSGTGQCRQTAVANSVNESTPFNNLMRSYIGAPFPTPAMTTTKSNDTLWYRGLTYVFGGGGTGTDVYIQASYAGDVNPCPPVASLAISQRSVYSGNTLCTYVLGQTTDP